MLIIINQYITYTQNIFLKSQNSETQAILWLGKWNIPQDEVFMIFKPQVSRFWMTNTTGQMGEAIQQHALFSCIMKAT